MRERPQRWRPLLLLLLFLAALLPRVVYPVSRPLQWYERSYRFVEAVLDRRWADTVVSEHPGVTPMWLIGAAQHAYEAARRIGGDPTYGLRAVDRAFDTEVFVSVFALALVISLAILLAWYLLKRSFGETVAWVGAGFIAMDPFHIAMSKVLHIDALLSMLMLLSALFLLLYLRQPADGGGRSGFWSAHRTLIASGVLGGLAFLTKSPAYFLIPYLGLCLLVVRWRTPLLRGYALPVLVWLGAAVTVYVLCWPAMWVAPVQTLETVFRGVALHAGRPHPQPLYYMGRLVTDDPGMNYYLASLLVKTTALTLPLSVGGAILSLRSLRRREWRQALLLVGYVVCFVVQMGLGAKKAPRYLLPVFPVISVLAGLGLVNLARCVSSRRGRLQAMAIVVAGLAVQALLVLPYHPYYATHASLLVGASRGARQLVLATPQGEGLDMAADYLNSQPDAETLRVGVQLPAREAVQQRFVGETLDTRDDDLDYLVFAEVYVRRGLAEDQWSAQWDLYRFRAPEYVAAIHGEPYAWVYAVDDGVQVAARPATVCMGEQIELLGHSLARPSSTSLDSKARPGEELLLTLHWVATAKPEGDYSVFVHLLGPGGRLVDQQDNVPVDGTYPVSLWGPGERVDDRYTLVVPPDGPGGRYQIVAGMYDWRTEERLRATAGCVRELPDNRVELASVDVLPKGIRWWQGLAAVVAVTLVVALGLCLWRPSTDRAQHASEQGGRQA